jgi:integrase
MNRLITALIHYRDYKNCPDYAWITDKLYFPEHSKISTRAILSPEEIHCILTVKRSFNQSQKRYQMWNLFFETLAITGLRPGELASVGNKCNTLNRIDFGMKALILEDTKTDARTVPLPDTIIDRFKSIHSNNLYYFRLQKEDRPITEHEWNYEFKSRLKKCKIERKGLSVYSLRHSYITEMVSETDIFSLMTLCGHRKATTTQRYFHSNLKKLRAESKKHPLLKREIKYEEVISMLDDLLKVINQIHSINLSMNIGNVPNGKEYRLYITQH